MSKNGVIILILLLIANLSYPTANKRRISVELHKKVVIAPKIRGAGSWQIDKYNKEIIELLEDVKEPFQSFIFQTIQSGEAEVKLKYIEKGKLTKNVTYIINIKDKTKKSLTKKDFQLTLGSQISSQQAKTIPQNTRLETQKQLPNNSYSLPEKAIMKEANIFYTYINQLVKRRLYHQVVLEIEKFRLLFPHDKKIEEINLLKGTIYSRLGQYQNAISWYRQLIEENVTQFYKTGHLMILLGRSYEKINDDKQAKLVYIKILTLYQNPKLLAQAHFSLGKIYFKEKKYQQGIAELEAVINHYPDAGHTREVCLFLLGEMYYKKSPLRDYKRAYHSYRILAEEYPVGFYSRRAIKKMKYLEHNFIHYY